MCEEFDRNVLGMCEEQKPSCKHLQSQTHNPYRKNALEKKSLAFREGFAFKEIL